MGHLAAYQRQVKIGDEALGIGMIGAVVMMFFVGILLYIFRRKG